MDAVKNILGTVAGVLGPIFHGAGHVFSSAGDVLSKMGSTIFVLGFIGILFTFLWFLFRYLDQKQLTLPTVIFVFFFFVFLSANLLMIAQDAKVKETVPASAAAQTVAAEAKPAAEPLPEGNVPV